MFKRLVNNARWVRADPRQAAREARAIMAERPLLFIGVGAADLAILTFVVWLIVR